jgi:prolipoprotein diacylglyceryltransferase
MVPTLAGLNTHDLFVAIGVLAGTIVFLWEVRRRRVRDDRIWVIVAGTLLGGAVFARLGTWLEHLDLRRNASLLEQWLYGNRSILSGLVGAYLGALAAKRLVGYTERTGDLFAPAVALAMAIGRIGCLLTELPGSPTSLPWAVTLTPEQAARIPHAVAGVGLHPSFAYEIIFQFAAFAAILWLRDRLDAPGELLTLYLVAYAVFRFLVEFVRGNEVVFAGLTRPQLFLAVCLPFAAWHVTRQLRRGTYQLAVSRTSVSQGRS